MDPENIPADSECLTVRVPELSEYLAKIDADYVSMPVPRSPYPKPACDAPPADTMPQELHSAILIVLLLISSVVGLVLASCLLLTGLGWPTAIGTYFAPSLVSLLIWLFHA